MDTEDWRHFAEHCHDANAPKSFVRGCKLVQKTLKSVFDTCAPNGLQVQQNLNKRDNNEDIQLGESAVLRLEELDHTTTRFPFKDKYGKKVRRTLYFSLLIAVYEGHNFRGAPTQSSAPARSHSRIKAAAENQDTEQKEAAGKKKAAKDKKAAEQKEARERKDVVKTKTEAEKAEEEQLYVDTTGHPKLKKRKLDDATTPSTTASLAPVVPMVVPAAAVRPHNLSAKDNIELIFNTIEHIENMTKLNYPIE